LLQGLQVDLLELHAHLQGVAGPAAEAQVVLERPALLALVLVVLAAAGADDGVGPVAVAEEVAGDEVLRPRAPERVLVGDVRVVEPGARGQLVAQVDAGLLVGVEGRGRRQALVLHLDGLALVAVLGGQLEVVVLADQPVDLAEVQVLLERRGVGAGAVLLAQPRRQLVRGEAAAQAEGARALVLLGLVGDEEVGHVADDRAAEADAVLLLLALGLGRALALLEAAARAPVGAGAVPEEAALEFVAARAGSGHDRGAAELVELGLVVLGDDLVLADRRLRERVAAAGVLAADAAGGHVVLLADAVDEHVDRVGALRAGTDAGIAAGVGNELHARRGIGEGQEVAGVLRQRLDLLLADVAGHLGGTGLHRRLGSDLHGLHRGRLARRPALRQAAHAEVDGRGLADLHGQFLRGALAVGVHLHPVGAGRQACQRVASFGRGLHGAAQAGGGVDRGAAGACRGRRVGIDLATDGGAGALRHGRAASQQQAPGQRDAQCAAHGTIGCKAFHRSLPGRTGLMAQAFVFSLGSVPDAGCSGPPQDARATSSGAITWRSASLADAGPFASAPVSIWSSRRSTARPPSCAILTRIVVKDG